MELKKISGKFMLQNNVRLGQFYIFYVFME